MNKTRRAEIAKVVSQSNELKEAVEALLEEEQEAFENMPEGIQDSERGEASQNAITELEQAVSAFEDIETMLETAAE